MPARVYSNRIRYYYENILRNDLLLKLNYNNIMEVPKIYKIILFVPGEAAYNSLKNASLALEIISGQKVFYEAAAGVGKQSRGAKHKLNNLKKKHKNATQGNSQLNSAFIYCSLRSEIMYNFLDKLFTICSGRLVDYKIQNAQGEIQITLNNREIRMFPEIQNHFEYFESFSSNLQIKLITSAAREEETQLLWTGCLQQKEI